MVDLGRVIYLDMQKSGSKYVKEFLSTQMTLPILQMSAYGRLEQRPPSDTFCFISVRDPVDQYVSLYRYGCDRKGGIYKRQLKNRLIDKLYGRGSEGFADWVDFVTDPENAELVDPRYAATAPGVFGLMTFRYLFLAISGLTRAVRGIESRNDLRKVCDDLSCVGAHVRTESLSDDLLTLSRSHLRPFLRDPDEAEAFLRANLRVNPS